MRTGLALLTVLLLTGCVRYYKVNDVRSKIGAGFRQLDKTLSKIDEDLQMKQRLVAAGAGPAAARHLVTMRRSRQVLKAHRVSLTRILREFEDLARGKRRIRSDSPQWEPMQRLRERMEQLGQQVKEAAESYKDASNAVAKLAAGR